MADPRPLPDDQLAAIAWADQSVSNVQPAEQLSLPRERVWAVRRRIQQTGHWSCPLLWSTCPECGESLASGPKPYRRTFHPACARQRAAASTAGSVLKWRQKNPERYQQIRERKKVRQRAEWRELPAEVRAAKLTRLAADSQRDNARTVPHATQTGKSCSPAEDAVLVARAADPDREVAIALGRTLWAVRNRKSLLLRLGRLSGGDG